MANLVFKYVNNGIELVQPLAVDPAAASAPQPVTISGVVSVSGVFYQAVQPVSGTFWQAVQPVSGTVGISNFPATQPVSGSVSVNNFPASQAVTGTFFQATQPVSIASLPAPAQTTSSSSTITSSANIPVFVASPNNSVKILAANPNRKGAIIYNNSANSIYMILSPSAGNAGTSMTFILATFAHLSLNQLLGFVWLGDVWATRNSGSGSATVTEFT